MSLPSHARPSPRSEGSSLPLTFLLNLSRRCCRSRYRHVLGNRWLPAARASPPPWSHSTWTGCMVLTATGPYLGLAGLTSSPLRAIFEARFTVRLMGLFAVEQQGGSPVSPDDEVMDGQGKPNRERDDGGQAHMAVEAHADRQDPKQDHDQMVKQVDRV